jgi:hypothetical protein
MAIIRDLVMNAFKARLQGITIENGYSREVGSLRVFPKRAQPLSVPTPGIVVMQAEELMSEYGSGYRRTLKVMLVFVDSYGGADPDGEASQFLADIQKAVMQETGVLSITVDKASGGTAPAKVTIRERQNVLNGYGPENAKVYGDVTYELDYRTSIHDPSVQGIG